MPEHHYPERSFGSKMSRSASPAKAKPSTVIMIAKPGKITIHGAVIAYCAAVPVSILPQEGNGSEMPRPKKLSPASVSMAVPNIEDMMIKNGATVFGRM